MLRPFELPAVSELPAYDDDPALFDPSPEWFVPALGASHREDLEEEGEGAGFRALIDEPEALALAWRSTGGERRARRLARGKRRRSVRAKRRRSGRAWRWTHAA